MLLFILNYKLTYTFDLISELSLKKKELESGESDFHGTYASHLSLISLNYLLKLEKKISPENSLFDRLIPIMFERLRDMQKKKRKENTSLCLSYLVLFFKVLFTIYMVSIYRGIFSRGVTTKLKYANYINKYL